MRNSQIILAKDINIDKNYNNVLNYTNTQMLELLQSQAHFVGKKDNCSFLGRENRISTSFTVDECLRANYIAFQNPSYSNKWFFAWIDDVIYKGDSNTEIQYTIDSWTTWFGYWNIKPCFVLREHVNDDTIGLNTELENLDVGEVVSQEITIDAALKTTSGFFIAISCNYQPNDNSTGLESLSSDKGTKYSGISVYNNVVNGTKILLFYITTTNTFVNVSRFIQRVNLDGEVSSIENMYILPVAPFNLQNLTLHSAKYKDDNHPFEFYTMNQSTEPYNWYLELNRITNYPNLNIKNNKCFCFPYNYILVSNNNGSNNIYKYENFYSNKCKFLNTFAVSVGGSGRVAPLRYKEKYPEEYIDFLTANDDESIPFGKFPTCSWSSDAFINWLTQNAVNIAVSGVFGILNTVASVSGASMTAKTSLEGSIGAKQQGLSASNSVAGFFGDLKGAMLLPNISGNQATGDVVWSEDRNCITYKQMRCKDEYIKKIDDYFTRFGYKINRLKIPNMVGRRYFNYIEISDSDEIGTGSVPEKYWGEINNACHRGITIWHNHENVGNFNLDNTIV